MPSDVDICNMALALVPTQSTIASRTERSTEARQCNIFYDSVRLELLQSANWNFARKTIALADISNPVDPWRYRYAYPDDAVKALYLVDPHKVAGYPSEIDYEVVNAQDTNNVDFKAINTNQENASLVYIRDVTNDNTFPPMFVTCLYHTLAARIASQLGADLRRMNQLTELAGYYMGEAMAHDANEGHNIDREVAPDFIRVRGYDDQSYTSPIDTDYYNSTFGGG